MLVTDKLRSYASAFHSLREVGGVLELNDVLSWSDDGALARRLPAPWSASQNVRRLDRTPTSRPVSRNRSNPHGTGPEPVFWGCTCAHCTGLSQYLADPERATWVLRAGEGIRVHVENTIRAARCDVDVTTERQGRPFSLVCTKNQASYERRRKQRKRDLTDLKRLRG